MPSPQNVRRLLTPLAGPVCWLVGLVASAQSVNPAWLEPSTLAPVGGGLSSAVAQPLEILPPAVSGPIVMDTSAAAWSPGPPASRPAPDFVYYLGGKARGYYINDQRIEFTGMESTFAVEGVIDGGVVQQVDGWEFSLQTQLFLNQPFDRTRLTGDPIRRSFLANFDIDPLQISQLFLSARNGDFYTAIGRFVTPFGRFYFPNYRNNFDDSPFIHSEAILFRETGFLVQWDPGIWVLTAALTNGGFQQDTNSSKALVARVGVDDAWYALGTSVKWQDGNGSETQKTFNNHVGLDAMVRSGSWTLSGEVIYDQYGLRRPGTPLNSITWGRSLYFRDLNNGLNNPITGVGYYVNLGYEGPNWTLMLNYGEFYPQHIGDRRQDVTSRRGLIKASRHWSPNFETYSVVLVENDLARAFYSLTRQGTYVIFGAQFVF